MDDHRKETHEQITGLFDSQQLAVLSTVKNDQPYASLVAFAASDDLEHLLFLTPNTTRKYDHLKENPKVAILVNNSQNQTEDIYNAVSVTGIGTASIVDPSDPLNFSGVFLKKHPHLKGFSSAPTTVLVCVTMNRYFMVNQFQNVVEFRVSP